MSVRLFFATDVHGSEACWRKFINSGKHYEADVLILGGDMTGKAVVPIIDNGGGKYTFHMQDVQPRHRRRRRAGRSTSARSAITATTPWS